MASLNVMLVPWKDRKGKDGNINNIMDKVQQIASRYQEAETFCLNPPAIQGLGLSSGLQMQLLDINNLGAQQMEKAIQDLKDAVKDDPHRVADFAVPGHRAAVSDKS